MHEFTEFVKFLKNFNLGLFRFIYFLINLLTY